MKSSSTLNAMVHRLLSVAFSFSLLTGSAAAQRESDSTVSYKMNEVVITGTRLGIISDMLPSSVAVFDRVSLEAKTGDVVASALQGAPGVYLRTYGGGGSLATLSLRGENPEHTLVLVDGQRFSNFQSGNTDLGIFSLSNVERIEVARGGYSSLYGADAVGGVINIITQQAAGDSRASIASTVGSSGYQSLQGNFGSSVAGIVYGGDAKIERGRGDFKFYLDDGSTHTLLRRDDSDFRMMNAGARFSGFVLSSLRFQSSVRYADAERGSPNGVTSSDGLNFARLHDQDVFAVASLTWTGNESLVPCLNSSYHYGHEGYTDPAYLSDDFYLNRSLTLSPELRFSLSQSTKGIVGADITHASIVSDVVDERSRDAQSAFLSLDNSILFDGGFLSDLVLYPSVRYDRYSDVTSDVSPKLGLNFGMHGVPNVRLRGSYGKSFRMPTFNEMYYKFGGNTSLKPERSLGFDGGIVASAGDFHRFSAEVNYFSIHMQDRIVWTVDADYNYTPKNIRSVVSTGVEVIAGWKTSDGRYSLDGNSTWTNATKQNEDYPGDPTFNKRLIYVPETIVNLVATATVFGVTCYVHESWVGRRFTTEANDKELPAYATTDIALKRSFSLSGMRLSVKGEMTNLFDESYQIIATYPMPLREFRVTAGVEL